MNSKLAKSSYLIKNKIMQTVKRYDFRFIGKNVKTTPQGFLVIPAYTARTGIQEYKLEDGKTMREVRLDEHVFSDVSMSSLRTAAVTNGHPVTMIDPTNAKELIVGHTDGTIEKVEEEGEGFLKTNLIITHDEAIKAIKGGRVQLSNGYMVDLDFQAGEYKGQKYDAIQRNIVNNHIALVDIARGGPKVRLRLDSKDAVIYDKEENSKGAKTMKIKIDGKEFDVSDEVGQAIKNEQSKIDGLKEKAEKADSLKTENETLKGEKENLEAKKDSLESDLEKAKASRTDAAEVEKQVKEAAKARVSVMNVAEKMLDGETLKKLDEMSDEEIKRAIIKVDSPKVEESKLEKSSYVDARFDHICENLDTVSTKKKDLGEKIVKTRKENKDGDDYKSADEIRLDNMRKDQEESQKIKAGE